MLKKVSSKLKNTEKNLKFVFKKKELRTQSRTNFKKEHHIQMKHTRAQTRARSLAHTHARTHKNKTKIK